jgi:hypothetical protein
MYRERLANEGLMLPMDGSHHVWYVNKERCLIAAIDDATSRIPATAVICFKITYFNKDGWDQWVDSFFLFAYTCIACIT